MAETIYTPFQMVHFLPVLTVSYNFHNFCFRGKNLTSVNKLKNNHPCYQPIKTNYTFGEFTIDLQPIIIDINTVISLISNFSNMCYCYSQQNGTFSRNLYSSSHPLSYKATLSAMIRPKKIYVCLLLHVKKIQGRSVGIKFFFFFFFIGKTGNSRSQFRNLISVFHFRNFP